MISRPLLIGEATSVSGGRPFDGRSGRMLAGLAGLSLEEFLDAVEAVNLLPRWPGRSSAPKGHAFPRHDAFVAARRIDLTGRTVVLAGKRVALAFGLREVKWLTPAKVGRGEAFCAVIPHPSGIVRWWNEARNGRAVARFLRRLLAGHLV